MALVTNPSKRDSPAPPRPTDESPHGLSRLEAEALRYRLHYWAASVERTGQEAGHAEAERERLAPTVEDLLGGLERRARAAERVRELERDPRVPRAGRAEAERALQAAQAELHPYLRVVMREGLERRLGCFLRGDAWRLYCEMLANGARQPDGLRVCEGCALVFVPRRKRGAKRCPHCHHRPRARAPLTALELPDGGVISRGLPGVNDGTRLVRPCRACGTVFFAKLASGAYCSPCGKGRTPPPKAPRLSPEERMACRAIAEIIGQRVLREAERRRASGEARRFAACDGCAAYFPTHDPTVTRCPECS